MKRITQLLTALVFCSLVIFVSCKKKGGSDDPDPRDLAAAALSKQWTPSAVTKDGSNRTEWEGFSISFTYNNDTDQGSYNVSGVPTNDGADAVWGSGLTWSFQGEGEDANTGVIVRSDGVTMQAQYDVENPTSLVLSFTITEASNRVAGFNGAWVFTLE